MKVMHPFVFVFCFTLALCASAQNQADSSTTSLNYRVPRLVDSLNLSEKGYYLYQVNDLRTNKKNIGYITIKGVKKELVFEDSLPSYLFSFIHPHSATENNGLKPLILNIEKLKTFSSTNLSIDEAQLYVKLNFQEKKENGATTVHAYERTLNYQKKSKPDFIPQLLKAAILPAFSGLRVSSSAPGIDASEEPKNNIVKETNENKTVYKIPMANKRFTWDNPSYYVSKVVDARNFKENEGTVLLGIFDRSMKAKLDSNLEYYIANLFISNPNEGKKPVSLVIKNFDFKEQLTPDGEQGHFFYSAQLVLDSGQAHYILHNFVLQFDTISESNITKAWPGIIEKVVQQNADDSNTKPLYPLLSLSNSSSNISNSSLEGIREAKPYLKKAYFWKETQLRWIRDFNTPFALDNDKDISKMYKDSKTAIRTGRVFMVAGSVFIYYSLLDFLSLEEKSFKKWYNNDPEASSKIMIGDKKVFLLGGAAMVATGFFCKILGKSLLQKTINRHNKFVAERLSFNYTPNFDGRGTRFQLNLVLGNCN